MVEPTPTSINHLSLIMPCTVFCVWWDVIITCASQWALINLHTHAVLTWALWQLMEICHASISLDYLQILQVYILGQTQSSPRGKVITPCCAELGVFLWGVMGSEPIDAKYQSFTYSLFHVTWLTLTFFLCISEQWHYWLHIRFHSVEVIVSVLQISKLCILYFHK